MPTIVSSVGWGGEEGKGVGAPGVGGWEGEANLKELPRKLSGRREPRLSQCSVMGIRGQGI